MLLLALQGKAGTIFITHWDTAHAGGSPGAITRFMVKFAYLRVVHPRSYAILNSTGSTPASVTSSFSSAKHPAASYHVFRWLRGLPQLSTKEVAALAHPTTNTWAAEAISAAGTSTISELAIADLISALNQRDQQRRLAAIYALAAIGQPAVESLLADLSQHKRRPRLLMQGDSGALVTDEAGVEQQQNHLNWSEDAVVCEDAAYALAAMEPSGELVTALVAAIESQCPELFDHEWMILNCVFVMGEIGTAVLDRCVTFAFMLSTTVRKHHLRKFS